MFSKADKATLAKYSKGLKVAATGTMRFGKIMQHSMRDCEIAPIVKRAVPVEKTKIAKRDIE